jgi:hypothetical protein
MDENLLQNETKFRPLSCLWCTHRYNLMSCALSKRQFVAEDSCAPSPKWCPLPPLGEPVNDDMGLEELIKLWANKK